MAAPSTVYRSRNHQSSDYYKCLEEYFEDFARIYGEHFSKQQELWRSYLQHMIDLNLDCGDLHMDFCLL